jgi:NAD dependent epimerase/dehydratase
MSGSKPVLVTGAGGFIGSHVVEQLVQSGGHIRAFVRYNSDGRRGWLDNSPVGRDIECVSGDVRDYDSVLRAARGASTIIHLAALVGIPYSYISPQAYLRTNVDGAYNILEAARACDVERVVLTSTSEIYGTAKELPMNELHPVDCQSPYAASKAAADQLGLSYFRSFGVPVIIVRPFNTYGPRQSLRAVIPAIIAQLLTADGVVQLGNIHPERDFTFVDDTVSGLLAAATTPELIGEIVHIGSGAAVSVEGLCACLSRLTGRPIALQQDPARVRPALSEVDRLLCDNRKLRHSTGWQPRVTLDEGLRRTIAWLEPRLVQTRAAEYSV